MAKHLPLPKRFSAADSETAGPRLRGLHPRYGLSNDHLLTVLLKRPDAYADPERLDAAFREVIAKHGAPGSGARQR